MKRAFLVILTILLLVSCKNNKGIDVGIIGSADGPTMIVVSSKEESKTVGEYKQITQAQAKEIMDTQKGFVILDVREDYEFAEGHIQNAICMSYLRTEELAPSLLPDKNQMILVYCRSGRRSKIAAQTLADMGYTNVLEFGGIIDWPYGIVK